MSPLLIDPTPAAAQPVLPGATLLRGFAGPGPWLPAIAAVAAQAPFRQMETPYGKMTAALTSCGRLGWTSDSRGYRYTERDPATGEPWPDLPDGWASLAARAAVAAGFDPLEPDSCVINRYAVGARMGAHQDRNERDFRAPIVSVSLGLTIRFFFEQRPGDRRAGRGPAEPEEPGQSGGRTTSLLLAHGDVLVWGGPARLLHHGVRPLAKGSHPETGPLRYNLTFRLAG